MTCSRRDLSVQSFGSSFGRGFAAPIATVDAFFSRIVWIWVADPVRADALHHTTIISKMLWKRPHVVITLAVYSAIPIGAIGGAVDTY
jgi:hypothetical protein